METPSSLTADERSRRIAACIRQLIDAGEDEDFVCSFHGIDMRLWRRAAFGRAVNADAHMAICSALGIDPASGERPAPAHRLAGPVCWATLGAGVRVTREMRGHSVRQAAEAAGVSAATISRCENGRDLSFDSLSRLAAYVGLHPHATTAPPFPMPAGSTGNTHCNALKTQEARHA